MPSGSATWGVSSKPYLFYKLLLKWFRNTRVTPVATYLAYKATGYADARPVGGMTISDFVSVRTPYNNGGGGNGTDPGIAGAALTKGMGAGGITAGPRDGLSGEER